MLKIAYFKKKSSVSFHKWDVSCKHSLRVSLTGRPMRPRAMANMLIRYLHYLEYYILLQIPIRSTNLASPTCTLAASFQKNLCGAQDKSVKISIRLASFRSTCIGQGDTIPLGHLFIGTNRKIMTRLFPSTTHREHAFFIFTA